MAAHLQDAELVWRTLETVINGIKDYLNTSDLLKMKRKARLRVSDLLVELVTERATFMNTLAQVLKFHLDDLHVGWKDKAIQAATLSIFGPCMLKAFISLLQELRESALVIESILKFDCSDKVCRYYTPSRLCQATSQKIATKL